jgi:ribonucleoside-diphosphate reductase alpha chain
MGNSLYSERLLEPLVFLPNSPTLFNIGIPGAGTLSACFKFDVDDTLLDGPSSIMGTAHKAAAVTKWGGGVGYYLGDIRPAGSYINTTHGKAMGPVEVLKMFQSVGHMITQAGKRDAAQMAVLPVDHPDIMDFIHVKDQNPEALATFNISVSITDEFMSRALDTPNGRESKILDAIALSAWTTGDPGVYFVDEAERYNPTPWLGKVTGVNPCGEVPLLNNEPCNLGSINLAKFVGPNDLDWDGLERTTRLAIRYLDDVLDHNNFPVDDITRQALSTRKLGLGVCGWADTLALLSIPYGSDQALSLGNAIMEAITNDAEDESYRIASEKGIAPAFEGMNMQAPRNATRTCIAPTGTIALLMGASSGIEPHFSLTWNRMLGTGDIISEEIPVLSKLGNFVPQTAMDIPWEWHIKHQAVFQRHTDLAVSKTVNMPNNSTPTEIRNAYVMMWTERCKGGTIFRDGSRDTQVLTVTTDKCGACGAEVKHEEGCISCAAGCGWQVCST